jgi:hypothetical protein
MEKRRERTAIRWRWGAAAALAMMILALFPQVHFWIVRGSQWNGSYAAMEGVGDEVAYSAYVNALIEGRPRRSDPYTGRDSTSSTPQPNSLFSIQFVPAYLIALPARAFGFSASTAFIALSPLAAGATALALFWLLMLGTGNERVAAAGVLVVLCFGTLVGGHGHASSFWGGKPLYNYLMFLRRYQPAATFPLFVGFCGTAWLALTSTTSKRRLMLAITSGVLFAVLTFSYVFLWTAAAAWLGCLALVWLVARPNGWRKALRSFAIITSFGAAAFAVFLSSYANRASSLETVQILELSHAPDLLRLPEIIAIVLLAIMIIACSRRLIDYRDPKVLLAFSFALLPLVVFNQQVITGRSMQPLHYEMFAANYSVLIALVLGIAAIRRNENPFRIKLPRKALLWIALVAFEWGSYETLVATRGSLAMARDVDDGRPVATRLSQLAASGSDKGTGSTLLCYDLLIADSFPTTAPQALVWAPHMIVFSGVTEAESKQRFYQQVYYSGIGPDKLKDILENEGRYGFASGIFGFDRTIKGLSHNPKPITTEELDAEMKLYEEYVRSFTAERARQLNLSYVVVSKSENLDFSNLDRWYERDSGEQIGKFILYRTRFRESALTSNQETKATDE